MSDDYFCPLCARTEYPKVHFETSLFWIADCKIYKVPIVVLVEHRPKFTQNELGEIMHIVKKLYNLDVHNLDFKMKQFPNHAHFHVRPKKHKKKKTHGKQ